MFARLINAVWCLQTSHKVRQWGVTIAMTAGFVLISWCLMGTQKTPGYINPKLEYKFWISLVASTIIGISTALGEANVVALLKNFPSRTIGYFGSGTGFAGISGTSMLLLMNAAGMKDWAIYMTAAPTTIPYIYCCLWIIQKSHMYKFVPEVIKAPNSEVDNFEKQQNDELLAGDSAKLAAKLNVTEEISRT